MKPATLQHYQNHSSNTQNILPHLRVSNMSSSSRIPSPEADVAQQQGASPLLRPHSRQRGRKRTETFVPPTFLHTWILPTLIKTPTRTHIPSNYANNVKIKFSFHTEKNYDLWIQLIIILNEPFTFPEVNSLKL